MDIKWENDGLLGISNHVAYARTHARHTYTQCTNTHTFTPVVLKRPHSSFSHFSPYYHHKMMKYWVVLTAMVVICRCDSEPTITIDPDGGE